MNKIIKLIIKKSNTLTKNYNRYILDIEMEMTVMDNLFDYLKWRSDLSFSRCRINELDFALFSQIIMIPYTLYIDMPMSKTNDSITLKDLAVLVKENKEKFVKKMGLIIPPQILDIVIKMGESHRYENIVVRNLRIDNTACKMQYLFRESFLYTLNSEGKQP